MRPPSVERADVATSELLILGAIAGLTIYLGLPIGRVRNPSMPLRAFLNASAIGILLFLLWDVLSKGIEPVTAALTIAANHGGSWLRFVQFAGVFAAALTLGLVSLVYYDRWLSGRAPRPHVGPGAAVAVAVRSGPVLRERFGVDRDRCATRASWPPSSSDALGSNFDRCRRRG